MLTTALKETLFRMSQLPKLEHNRVEKTLVWARSSYARAKKLGQAGKKATQARASLCLSPRSR